MGLPSLRYARPAKASRPTSWAQDWRSRWFRYVGSVHEHHATHELVAFYSDARDPTARLALQRELEQRPNGAAQVLAVCRKVARDIDRQIIAAYARREVEA